VVVLANGMYATAQVLDVVLQIYMWILIARAVLSWVNPDPRNPIVAFLGAVTDPLLRVIRRRLPMSLRYFPLDIAFLVLIGLVLFTRYFLVQSLQDYALLLRARALGMGIPG
jgi:YggT family protein